MPKPLIQKYQTGKSDLPSLKSEFIESLRGFAENTDFKNPDTRTFFDEKGQNRTSFLRASDYIPNGEDRFAQALKKLEEGDPTLFLELAVELKQIGLEFELNNGKGEENYEAGETVQELVLLHSGNIKNILSGLGE